MNFFLNKQINKQTSRINIGPVAEIIFNGCPENKEKATPHTEPATMHSMVPIRFPVFLPSIPPNATNEHKHTRYMYKVVARHCKLRQSVKSLT